MKFALLLYWFSGVFFLNTTQAQSHKPRFKIIALYEMAVIIYYIQKQQ